MNNERSEDDSWTCSDCGQRNFPDVGMSMCDCKLERVSAYHEANSKPERYSPNYGSQVCREAPQVMPGTTLKYEFVMHQTDKAILFAIKDSRGIYQQWVPRSVITKLGNKEVTISTWFARRLYGN